MGGAKGISHPGVAGGFDDLPEQAFRNALEQTISGGVAVIGPDGRHVYVNAGFCDLVGWSEQELLSSAPPFAYWPAQESDRAQAAFDQMLRGEAPPAGFELRFQHRSGELVDVEINVAPVAGGMWLVHVTDIGARKRRETRHSVEQEITAVLHRSRDFREAAPGILHTMCKTLGWDMGSLWMLEHGTELVPIAQTWRGITPKAADGIHPVRAGRGAGVAGLVLESRKPVWIRDVQNYAAVFREPPAEAAGLRGAMAFPVLTSSGLAGIVELFCGEVLPAESGELAFAAALGRRIGEFIDREHTQNLLRQSSDRFRTIVEMANEGVWLLDPQGRTLFANVQLGKMLGCTPEELVSRPISEFCFPEDQRAAQERIRANLSGRSEQFDFRFRREDGAELLVLACTSPMRDADGTISGALGMFLDVTERKKADDATHRLAAIVESSDDAIIGKTLDGIIQSWNSAAERIYGYTAEEAIGRSMTMLLPPERPDEENGILMRLQRGERVEHFETVRLRKDGKRIDVSTTISPIRNKSGHIIGASSVTRDITERRRFEEQLRDTQKLESLGVLAGGVAHDFNNLLVGIMGNASLALDTVPPENPARSMIDGVLRASERAAELTRQLLAYSGKGRFVIQPMNLSLLIREIVALIQTSISKSVRVRFELDETVPDVEADVAQIQQLIMNLVINAAEAIGEVPGTITIRTSEQRRAGMPWVCLEVDDTGSGMDEATKERIFDPFFTTKFTGRGLGLAAALGIVRGHNGSIRVDSTPGKGTRFTVMFPASGAKAPLIGVLEEERDFRGHGTVLVVDDEEIVRATAKATLERYGYHVLLASDGEEALECMRHATDIDMVLLDLTMPGMSGEQALLEMRRQRPGIRVILSSGYNEVEAIRRFHGQGLAGFLQKPYSAQRLAEKVKMVAAAA